MARVPATDAFSETSSEAIKALKISSSMMITVKRMRVTLLANYNWY